MKNLIILFIMALGTLQASAQEYNYLTLQETDGTETSLTVDGLKIIFVDGSIVVTNGTQNFTAPLASMSKMYFAETATAINSAIAAADEASVRIVNGQLQVNAPDGSRVKVYGLDGREQGTSHLTRGVYVVRVNNQTFKVIAQ